MTSGTKGEWFVHVALFLSVTHFRTVSKQFSPPWTAGALSEKRSHLFSPSLTWSLEPGSCYSGVSGTVSVSMRVTVCARSCTRHGMEGEGQVVAAVLSNGGCGEGEARHKRASRCVSQS